MDLDAAGDKSKFEGLLSFKPGDEPIYPQSNAYAHKMHLGFTGYSLIRICDLSSRLTNQKRVKQRTQANGKDKKTKGLDRSKITTRFTIKERLRPRNLKKLPKSLAASSYQAFEAPVPSTCARRFSNSSLGIEGFNLALSKWRQKLFAAFMDLMSSLAVSLSALIAAFRKEISSSPPNSKETGAEFDRSL
ncbi:MAG: hypothetical protein AAGA53_17675 [Pseudomonadota bacterium]